MCVMQSMWKVKGCGCFTEPERAMLVLPSILPHGCRYTSSLIWHCTATVLLYSYYICRHVYLENTSSGLVTNHCGIAPRPHETEARTVSEQVRNQSSSQLRRLIG